MAEGIARKLIHETYPDCGIEVSSAGLNTFNGSPASQNAIDACREIGVDLMSHRSQRLNAEIAERTDLFAVMTAAHGNFLRQCGIPADKIVMLGDGIPDPFGGDMDIYRACRDAIAEAVTRLIDRLASQSDHPDTKTVTVVPMEPAHIPAIAQIERECFSTPWSEAALTEELTLPAAHFVTALADGTVTGYMGMQVAGDVGYVCNVAVSPDFRRRGVASALIQAQINYAAEHGIQELSLEVRSSNTPARTLYEKMGFVHLGTRPHFYRDPEEDAEIYSFYHTQKG